MIFPFEIKLRFSLPVNIFADYSSDQIIDKIYENISKESVIILEKKNNVIEFKGDKSKTKFYKGLHWAMFIHCIDNGIVKIDDHIGERKIIYKFQIQKILLLYLIPITIVFIISLNLGNFILFWAALAYYILLGIITIAIQSSLISDPIYVLRCESIRKKY